MADNKYVSVAYKLYTKNSEGEIELTEEAPVAHPFNFISGMGFTLDKFEAEMLSRQKGDEFDFTISCADAYGDYEQEAVLSLDKKMFEVEGKFDSEYVAPGRVIPLQNADGQRFNGTVTDVTADKVVVDMNHPLAGHDLNFKGQIVELRDATNEEITSFVNALSGGGCGSCGGGCEGGCGGEGGCHHEEGGCKHHGEGKGKCGCH